MRTQEQILARIESVKNDDFFGTIRGGLIEALTFENAKSFLKEGVTADQWSWNDEAGVRKAASDYLVFAWGEANDCRRLSASRNVDHYRAWMWLLGCDDFDALAEREYEFYGKPVLVIVSAYLGANWRLLDDGEWKNNKSNNNFSPSVDEIARLEKIATELKAD